MMCLAMIFIEIVVLRVILAMIKAVWNCSSDSYIQNAKSDLHFQGL